MQRRTRVVEPEQAIKIIIAIMLCTILALAIYQFSIRNYEEVEATVVGADSERNYKSKNRANYTYYEYTINGEIVVGKTPVIFQQGNRLGKTELIRVNPGSPEKIASKLCQRLLFSILILSLVMLVHNIRQLKGKKKRNFPPSSF